MRNALAVVAALAVLTSGPCGPKTDPAAPPTKVVEACSTISAPTAPKEPTTVTLGSFSVKLERGIMWEWLPGADAPMVCIFSAPGVKAAGEIVLYPSYPPMGEGDESIDRYRWTNPNGSRGETTVASLKPDGLSLNARAGTGPSGQHGVLTVIGRDANNNGKPDAGDVLVIRISTTANTGDHQRLSAQLVGTAAKA